MFRCWDLIASAPTLFCNHLKREKKITQGTARKRARATTFLKRRLRCRRQKKRGGGRGEGTAEVWTGLREKELISAHPFFFFFFASNPSSSLPPFFILLPQTISLVPPRRRRRKKKAMRQKNLKREVIYNFFYSSKGKVQLKNITKVCVLKKKTPTSYFFLRFHGRATSNDFSTASLLTEEESVAKEGREKKKKKKPLFGRRRWSDRSINLIQLPLLVAQWTFLFLFFLQKDEKKREGERREYEKEDSTKKVHFFEGGGSNLLQSAALADASLWNDVVGGNGTHDDVAGRSGFCAISWRPFQLVSLSLYSTLVLL